MNFVKGQHFHPEHDESALGFIERDALVGQLGGNLGEVDGAEQRAVDVLAHLRGPWLTR